METVHVVAPAAPLAAVAAAALPQPSALAPASRVAVAAALPVEPLAVVGAMDVALADTLHPRCRDGNSLRHRRHSDADADPTAEWPSARVAVKG